MIVPNQPDQRRDRPE